MVARLLETAVQQFKNWMFPIAMFAGILFYRFFVQVSFLTPYLIFCMLLVPYCKISLQEMRIKPLHIILVAIQITGALLIYLLLRFYNPTIAEGTFICILAPTATSAAVITGMLGGNITSLATLSLVSNFTVALLSPLIFSFIGGHVTLPFGESFLLICRQMVPLLILPFVIALLLQRFAPRIHHAIKKRQQISFYLWAISLTIVMSRTMFFLLHQDRTSYHLDIILASTALAVCMAQFLIGRRLGARFRDKIAGAQGLGQKNTVLAIWMAQTYLLPVCSIGPAFYVVWQNIVNSYQLWYKRRHGVI